MDIKELVLHKILSELCVNLCVPCVKFNHEVHKGLHKVH